MRCINAKCNFDYGFIQDYDKMGNEIVFCHNCGTVQPGQIDMFPKTKVSFAGELYAYGNDCPRGGCE